MARIGVTPLCIQSGAFSLFSSTMEGKKEDPPWKSRKLQFLHMSG